MRRRGTAGRPNWQQSAVGWRLACNDIARISEVDGTGDSRGACLESNVTRHARRAMEGCLEVARQIVVLKGSHHQESEINRHLDVYGPERATPSGVANH